jgi:hypothetical protein
MIPRHFIVSFVAPVAMNGSIGHKAPYRRGLWKMGFDRR